MSADQSLRARLAELPGPAWIVCAGMLVNRFGNFLNVFLVLYLTGQGFSALQAGLAVSVTGLGAFAGNVLGGSLADRMGRRRVIAVSMLGSGLATLCVPAVHGLWAVITLVGAVGLFAQLYRPAAGALLIDVVDESRRVTAFAVLRLAINLGTTVGPMVGGLLSTHSYTLLFTADALTSFVFALLALMLPPDAPRKAPAGAAPSPARGAGRGGGYRELLRDRPFLLFLLTLTAGTVVYVQSTVALPLWVTRHGLGNGFYGLLLAVNAVVCVVVELPLTRWTERREPRRTIAAGMLLMGLGMAATGLADARLALVGTVLVWTFGEIVYSPVASGYTGAFSPPHLRARYQAADGLAHNAGQTIGPLIGGLLYSRSSALLWGMCGVAALLGAAAALRARPGTAAGTAAELQPVAAGS